MPEATFSALWHAASGSPVSEPTPAGSSSRKHMIVYHTFSAVANVLSGIQKRETSFHSGCLLWVYTINWGVHQYKATEEYFAHSALPYARHVLSAGSHWQPLLCWPSWKTTRALAAVAVTVAVVMMTMPMKKKMTTKMTKTGQRACTRTEGACTCSGRTSLDLIVACAKLRMHTSVCLDTCRQWSNSCFGNKWPLHKATHIHNCTF